MSDTNQQPPTPLLYQMGLAVGQSIAGVAQQVREDIGQEIVQHDDELERIRLSLLLKLGMF